jgi:hypothetical protein
MEKASDSAAAQSNTAAAFGKYMADGVKYVWPAVEVEDSPKSRRSTIETAKERKGIGANPVQ